MKQETRSRVHLVMLLGALCWSSWGGFRAAAVVMPVEIAAEKISPQKAFIAAPEPVQEEMLRIFGALNSQFLAARAAGGFSIHLTGGGLCGATIGKFLPNANKKVSGKFLPKSNKKVREEQTKIGAVVGVGLGGLLPAFNYWQGGYSHLVVQNSLANDLITSELNRPDEMALGSLLPADHAMSQRVRRVAEKLAPIANAWALPATKLHWRVTVVDDKSWSAWCAPGGLIAVHTGMLEELKSDDELAAVIGHEMAHAMLHHSGQKIVKQCTSWLDRGMIFVFVPGISFITVALMDTPKWNFLFPNLITYGWVVSSLMQKLQRAKRSRIMEREADFVGLIVMWQAGFKPDVIPTLWARQAATNKEDGEFVDSFGPYFSTHPTSTERSERLKKWVELLESVSLP